MAKFPPRYGEFGYAVAISGSVAVIGAPGVRKNAGAAYIYVRSGGKFRRQVSLPDPAGLQGDEFGYSVAVSYSRQDGAVVVIGAPFTNNDHGVAYVYTRSGSKWHREAALRDPSPADPVEIGFAVGVSGATLIATGPDARKYQGAAYIYARFGQTWRLQSTLANPREHRGDYFGFSAAISGTTAAVGAWRYGSREPDRAYVYVRQGVTWQRQVRLPDPGAVGNGFGNTVALSGSLALVGAINNNGGEAYVFARVDDKWSDGVKLVNPRPGPMDYFGVAIAISGPRIVIGADTNDGCGSVFEYRQNKGVWKLETVTIEPRCQAGDTFGSAVAISGRTMLIGAAGHDAGTGAAYYLTMP